MYTLAYNSKDGMHAGYADTDGRLSDDPQYFDTEKDVEKEADKLNKDPKHGRYIQYYAEFWPEEEEND